MLKRKGNCQYNKIAKLHWQKDSEDEHQQIRLVVKTYEPAIFLLFSTSKHNTVKHHSSFSHHILVALLCGQILSSNLQSVPHISKGEKAQP